MYQPDSNRQQVDDIYRLTRENNQMLHSMRRSAYFWAVVKAIIFIISFAAPIWFYMTYISGNLDQMVSTMNQIQTMKGESQKQFTGFQDGIKKIRERLPSFLQGYILSISTTSTTTVSMPIKVH